MIVNVIKWIVRVASVLFGLFGVIFVIHVLTLEPILSIIKGFICGGCCMVVACLILHIIEWAWE